MTSERNQRIAAFRKVSGYLIWVSMPLLILTGLIGAITLLIFACLPSGDVSLVDIAINMTSVKDPIEWIWKAKLNISSKISCIAIAGIGLYMATYIIFYFHGLIECFYEGEIFNKVAVNHARKAYKMNLYLAYFAYGCQLLAIGAAYYAGSSNIGLRIDNLVTNILMFLIELGFLSLMLWALEIGTNLNEEAELTI
ncbi:hypothetical protein [Undibacterium sp. Ji22W]|uniref:hypothetical protein n=1 Tax=Undibacterium sp. Ji22W TaxID=3413038 RepID=UPI003BF07E1F